jgi:hypothetical protein
VTGGWPGWVALGVVVLTLWVAPTAAAQVTVATPTATAATAGGPTPSPTGTPNAGGQAARAGWWQEPTPTRTPTRTPTPTPTPQGCRVLISPASASLAVELTGQDSWADGTLGASRVANGCGGGWHVDASTTRFTSGGRALPADALRVTGVAVQVLIGVAPSNDLIYPVLVVADAAPARVFRATGTSGIGVFDLTPGVRLLVPADAYAGGYSGSVTLTMAAGP